jgi:hypothetical protein
MEAGHAPAFFAGNTPGAMPHFYTTFTAERHNIQGM